MKYLFNPYNYDLTDPESIPNLFLQHLYLVAIAMIISLIIAIPLGIFIARRPRWYAVTITIADFLYTIPGVALIGILITIVHLSPIAIIIPLICYTQLALLRNTAAAIRGVDPLLLEVGKAMGMSRWQLLRARHPPSGPTSNYRRYPHRHRYHHWYSDAGLSGRAGRTRGSHLQQYHPLLSQCDHRRWHLNGPFRHCCRPLTSRPSDSAQSRA